MQAAAAVAAPAGASRRRLPGCPWQDVRHSSGYFPRRPRCGSTYQSQHAVVANGPSPHGVRELLLTCQVQRIDTPFSSRSGKKMPTEWQSGSETISVLSSWLRWGSFWLQKLSCRSCHVRQSRRLPMLGLPCLLCSTSRLQAPLNSRSTGPKAKAPISLRIPAPCRHRRSCDCRAQTRQQDNRPSPVRDAQDTELATADQQAKQDLYAQLLDRQKSSSPSEVSTSENVGYQQAKLPSGQPDKGSTELIFRLERRGEGWGEEIFPHLVVEQRPWTTTAKRDRNRSSRPKPWTVCDLFLNAQAHVSNLTCLSCALFQTSWMLPM